MGFKCDIEVVGGGFDIFNGRGNDFEPIISAYKTVKHTL